MLSQLAVLMLINIFLQTCNPRYLADIIIKVVLTFFIIGVIEFFLTNIIDLRLINYPFHDFSGHDFIWQTISTTHAAFYIFGGFNWFRMTFYFDEPGTSVFFLTIAIFLNRIYQFNKSRELILMLCGIFSFSLYYFIFALFYLLTNVKKVNGIIIFCAVFLSGLTVFYFMANDYFNALLELFNNLYFERLLESYDENNRQVGYANSILEIIKNPVFGSGRENEHLELGGSGYIRYIAQFGIIGGFVLLLHILNLFKSVLYSGILLSDKLLIIIGFVIMLLHREHVIQLFAYSMVILMIIGLRAYKQDETKK
jgi:hypothetical protein